MKFLHTSDWHIGKTLKGRPRLDEQRAVLAEIVEVAKAENVDAVLIAGDLYDSAAPAADAQRAVVRTLVELRGTGAEVIAMAGNHDHAATFDAYRPLMTAAGIQLVGQVRTPDAGGLVRFTARSTGEQIEVAVLPFLSQRYAVRAAELLTQTPAENAGTYDQLIRDILAAFEASFTPGAVHLVMAHLTVTHGVFGGGERAAQSIFEYHVPATVFGASPHYVALGHLHRRQSLAAACPVHYSGAPLAVDFGEQDNTNVVVIVEAGPETPASTRDVPISAGRRLRTVRGTGEQLAARAAEFGEDYLRVFVTEPARAGLREAISEALPNALEVRIDPEFLAPVSAARRSASTIDRTPGELFAEYCRTQGADQPQVAALFSRLHDELTSPDLLDGADPAPAGSGTGV